MRKNIKKVIAFAGIVLVIAGCSNGKRTSDNQNKNGVATVIEQQTKKENSRGTEEIEAASEVESINEIEAIKGTEAINEINNAEVAGVDIDLTNMGSDMVYATVYQFLVDPDTYIGKTVRMKGKYSCIWYEPTEAYYHYVIIEDAMACCASGLEFVWEDGTHNYPEEYPQEEQLVEVTGVFETYYEEVDDCWYCRLNHATLEVME